MSTGTTIQNRTIAFDLNDIDAFIFDMDGVVTNTAKAHAMAWKMTFDEFLKGL